MKYCGCGEHRIVKPNGEIVSAENDMIDWQFIATGRHSERPKAQSDIDKRIERALRGVRAQSAYIARNEVRI